MPNRILKESICTSENIDQLSALAEISFYRLIVNCDDYGRMDGRVKIIKSRLFPLRDISEDDMLHILAELEHADLITSYKVDGKPYLQMKTWENHQQVRNHKSKYPSQDEADCNQLQSIDIICNQLKPTDSKCPRNPIQSLSESESLSESLIADDDAKTIQKDHDRVLTAAEDAGIKMSNNVRASLIALYAEYGLEKVLDGIKSCSDHGAPNLAYLKACMNGKPKSKARTLPAQDFPQRDYSGIEEDMMTKLSREMAEFKKEVG